MRAKAIPMTQPESPGAPLRVDAQAESAAFANAYAIAYRLLGERAAARTVAMAVAESYTELEGTDASLWLVDLAADTVTASLLGAPAAATPTEAPGGPAGTGSDIPAGNEPDDATGSDAVNGLRTALRRRLSSADMATRAAVALHHLAGYPEARVAQLMAVSLDEVHDLCGPFAPPPGMSYRELGDPVVRGEYGPVVRTRRRRRKVPVTTVLAVVLVAALVWWASSRTGPRPRLGDPAPVVEAHFGAHVAPLPSEGCTDPGAATASAPATAPATSPATTPPTAPEPLTTALTTTMSDKPVGYRLRIPAVAPATPAPLVLALPGYQQTAQQFEENTRLDAALPGAFVATLEPVVPLLELNASESTERRDDRAAASAVVDAVVVDRCIDLRRVHVVGFGPGGQLAGDLVCAAPETFATASMVAGSRLPPACALSPAVDALLTANADDAVLPPSGGYGSAAATVNPVGTPARPDAEALDGVAGRWAEAIGAHVSNVDAEADDTLITTRTGPDGLEVLSMLHPAGGHAWGPGDTVAVADFIGRHGRQT